MDPIIEKAKADYAEVSAQIARLNERRAKLKAFLDIYDDASARSEPMAQFDTVEIPPKPKPQTAQEMQNAIRRPFAWIDFETGTAKARITAAVATILSDGRARHTRELLDLLGPNLQPGSQDKIIGLSNLLSRDDRFVADRSVGWSLKK